jgi:hypothetical protein
MTGLSIFGEEEPLQVRSPIGLQQFHSIDIHLFADFPECLPLHIAGSVVVEFMALPE